MCCKCSVCAAAAATATLAIKDKIDLDKMTDIEMAAFQTDLADQIIALFPGLEAADIATIVLQAANAAARRSHRAAAAAEAVVTFKASVDQTLATSVVAAMDAAITAGTFKVTVTVANVTQVLVFTGVVAGTTQVDLTTTLAPTPATTTMPATAAAVSETVLNIDIDSLTEADKDEIATQILAQNIASAGGAFDADDVSEVYLVAEEVERSVVTTATTIDNTCSELGDAGVGAFAAPSAATSAAGGTATATCGDNRRHRRSGATITVSYSFPLSTGAGTTDSAAILDLVRAQAAVVITFTLAAGGSVTAPAAVAATAVVTVTETFVKVVIVFNADTVTATSLAAVADTINALPAADKVITVGGISVQPEAVVVAITTATTAAASVATTLTTAAPPTTTTAEASDSLL